MLPSSPLFTTSKNKKSATVLDISSNGVELLTVISHGPRRLGFWLATVTGGVWFEAAAGAGACVLDRAVSGEACRLEDRS